MKVYPESLRGSCPPEPFWTRTPQATLVAGTQTDRTMGKRRALFDPEVDTQQETKRKGGKKAKPEDDSKEVNAAVAKKIRDNFKGWSSIALDIGVLPKLCWPDGWSELALRRLHRGTLENTLGDTSGAPRSGTAPPQYPSGVIKSNATGPPSRNMFATAACNPLGMNIDIDVLAARRGRSRPGLLPET